MKNLLNMKSISLSIKIIVSLAVILVLIGTILKLCEIAAADTVLHFGIAFGLSVFIYGFFDKKNSNTH